MPEASPSTTLDFDPPTARDSHSRLGSQLSRLRVVAARHFAAISQTFFVYDAEAGVGASAMLALVAPRLALSALVSSVLARVTAERAGASRALLDAGLTELNGWFLGLACGTFFASGSELALALLLGGSLVGVVSIVLQRVLATWDMPLLVGPYVPTFWLLWSGLAVFPWHQAAVLPTVAAHSGSAFSVVLLGGLRGLGEIFFVPSPLVGLGLAAAASIADWRLGPALVGASVASVGVGYLLGSPAWQVDQGLAGFTAALVAVAALRGFAGLGWMAVAVAIVVSPFLEGAALRLAGSVGLQALSVSYLGFFWVCGLVRPVRSANASGPGWSMSPRSNAFSPRETAKSARGY